ncbi:MAG: FISUMP domain-containing protein [Bacilli bacterium]
MKITIQSIVVALIWIFATLGCSPDAITNYAEEEIVAEQGGVVVTESGITLVIPAGAFEGDGVVFVGKTGEEPSTVPNPDLTVVGEPFTVKLPVDTLLAPLTLSFPLPAESLTVNNGVFLLYNGTSYFPFEYEIVDGRIVVTIDTINWEDVSTKGKIAEFFGFSLFSDLIDDQVHIDDRYLGIKEVSIVSGEVKYNEPANINSSSKILIFVHGLTGDPTGWEEYVKKIIQESPTLSYTNIWTYGYHSDKAIDIRGDDFKKLLDKYLKGKNPTIHIVAHSMGGLVSRSMIERYGGASLVDKLITLGTPHLGSPAEPLRHIISSLVLIQGDIVGIVPFYKNTLGAKDLNPKSDFIKRMKELAKPPIPYYTIACKNNGAFDDFFDSPNDGLVSVNSAIGVNASETSTAHVTIPTLIAHLHMRTFEHEDLMVNSNNGLLYSLVERYLENIKPTVTTREVININSTTATFSGNIVWAIDGWYESRLRTFGFCWSTSENPTTKNSKTTNTTYLGTYSYNITGLSPNTTYYVRAYATNAEGTAYGEQKTFMTDNDSNIEYGSLTDSRDGSVYKTITIDGKEWMAENLKYLPSVVGPATSSQTTSCYYVYDYNGTSVSEAKATANYQTYGVLYNWPAAMNGAATSNTIPSGVQGACPPGWHLPSDAEWQQLEMYLGMSQSEAEITGWRGTAEGSKLKHPGTEYWASPNTGATNSSGFTALPGGLLYNGTFQSRLGESHWWSSTQNYDQVAAWWRYLSCSESKVYRSPMLKEHGLSVRCVKD